MSLTFFTVGAILAFAVHADMPRVNLNIVGVIFMLVAVLGHVISPSWADTKRRMTVIYHGGSKQGRTSNARPLPQADIRGDLPEITYVDTRTAYDQYPHT
jgi:hypothetical protein